MGWFQDRKTRNAALERLGALETDVSSLRKLFSEHLTAIEGIPGLHKRFDTVLAKYEDQERRIIKVDGTAREALAEMADARQSFENAKRGATKGRKQQAEVGERFLHAISTKEGRIQLIHELASEIGLEVDVVVPDRENGQTAGSEDSGEVGR